MLPYFVWGLLGLGLVGWILWRGIKTELGLILLALAGWLVRQLPRETLHEINVALAVVLGGVGCVVLVVLVPSAIERIKQYRLFKPPSPLPPAHPQPGDADYLDWANHRGKHSDGTGLHS